MEHWVNKYIGKKYEFGKWDCLRLAEKIFRDELGYEIKEEGKPVTEDWYKQNPDRLIREAVKHGEIITDIKNLKEFDAVFFRLGPEKLIRHVGIMTSKYGHFIHQLENSDSRVNNLNEKPWNKRWHCGVRIKVGL